MAGEDKILSKHDVAEIDRALRLAHDLLPKYDKLEDCGQDCQEFRNETMKVVEVLTKFKQHFG